jgi:hypothetical protein
MKLVVSATLAGHLSAMTTLGGRADRLAAGKASAVR